MQRTNQRSILYPNYVAASVLEIDTKQLRQAGITHLAFDIDETVMPKKHLALTKEYNKFLQSLGRQGFTLMIGSNAKRDFNKIAKSINATVVPPSFMAFKPLKGYFRRLATAANTRTERIAMVGDRVLNDVIGANHAGLQTILVRPYARRQRAFSRFYFNQALSRVRKTTEQK